MTDTAKRLARSDAGYCRRQTKVSGGSYSAALRETAERYRHTATRYRALDPCLEGDAAKIEAIADELDRMADRART